MISETCLAQDINAPFACVDGELDDICVSSVEDCCKSGSLADTVKFCPSLGKCLNTVVQKCCEYIEETPLYCKTKSNEQDTVVCVANTFECCED